MFIALEVCLAAGRSTEEEDECVCSENREVEDSCGLTTDSLTPGLHLCSKRSVALSGPRYFYLARRPALLACITPITTSRKGENQTPFFLCEQSFASRVEKREHLLEHPLCLSLSFSLCLLFDWRVTRFSKCEVRGRGSASVNVCQCL